MPTEPCKDCGESVSSRAARCPHCGRPLRKFITGPKIAVLVVIVLSVGFFLQVQKRQRLSEERDAQYESALEGLREAGRDGIASIYDEVAADAVRQYGIAKRQGDPMQICAQAGFVVAGYLQAKNEVEYRRWKDTQKADCTRAGMPE